ncbi:MAG TPA: THUMP domain-containing protein [Candidatus Nanoarchaeia archaeon]|nr:THUMP domain-containing protein [Candidatus Nanoarchaeia archaeon]
MTMRAAALANPGLEDISALEIREKTGAESSFKYGIILFESEDLSSLFRLGYTSQSLHRLMFLLNTVPHSSKEAVIDAVKHSDFSDYISKDVLFSVECERWGTHEFSSADIEHESARIITGLTGGKFSRDNTNITVIILISDSQCCVGIDLAGYDIGKRQYRLFITANEIRATIAYSMLRIAGFSKKSSLLDPFSTSGTITIEAALHASELPVQHYSKHLLKFQRLAQYSKEMKEEVFDLPDKEAKANIALSKGKILNVSDQFGYVSSAQKNSKIAGVKEMISFSRIDSDWLDIKIEKSGIDMIVTNLPKISDKNGAALKKILATFFDQAGFVLSKKGVIVLSTIAPETVNAAAAEAGFILKEKREVMQGKQELFIISLEKKQ